MPAVLWGSLVCCPANKWVLATRPFRFPASEEREFYLHLLGRNVIVPGVHLAFPCAANSPEDVDRIIAAFKESFLDLRADGLYGQRLKSNRRWTLAWIGGKKHHACQTLGRKHRP